MTYTILIVLYSPFQKNKHWNPGIFGYWVLGAGCLIEKPQSPRLFKRLLKIIVLAYIYQLAEFGDFMICGSKMHFIPCTNTHRDVTDLVNHGMVKNTKTWISWERNIIFLWNKKILNLCFRWHILRSYHFVAEVIFNGKKQNEPWDSMTCVCFVKLIENQTFYFCFKSNNM